MMNWLATLGCVVTGIVVGVLLESKGTTKYERKCLNCQHYLLKGPLGDNKLMTGMCQHSMSFRDMPIASNYYCGKFDLTAELKGECIREGLDKAYKKGKSGYLSNNGEQENDSSNIEDDDNRSYADEQYPADEDGEDNE